MCVFQRLLFPHSSFAETRITFQSKGLSNQNFLVIFPMSWALRLATPPHVELQGLQLLPQTLNPKPPNPKPLALNPKPPLAPLVRREVASLGCSSCGLKSGSFLPTALKLEAFRVPLSFLMIKAAVLYWGPEKAP